MMLFVSVTGKLHAAAGSSGPSSSSDEERPEEEGHCVSLSATGAWGLHLADQREVGVHLWETPAVPVQSECPQLKPLWAELFYIVFCSENKPDFSTHIKQKPANCMSRAEPLTAHITILGL